MMATETAPPVLDDIAADQMCLTLAREDFAFFVMRAFAELYGKPLHPNWHILAIAHWLEKVRRGETRRLNIAIPPRSLKSFMASVCFPAFVLGHNPREKIVAVSYSQPLAEEFAFDTRKLMQSEWYRSVFPGTHLNPKKSNMRVLETTKGGQRRTTSVEGALTGLGGDLVILDDIMKAGDTDYEAARERVLGWYSSTVTSRLDDPKKGRIINIAQRLHLEDLTGYLLAQGYWEVLELPLIEWKTREIEIGPDQILTRQPGNLLHEDRIGEEEIAQLRAEMGERLFEAQYNQRPMPPGGALIKGEWLKRYSERPKPQQVQGIIQSWDTAYDIQEHNDYSVCSTWALSGKRCYLLDIYREKLEFPDLERAIYRHREEWQADLVIVEKAGSGFSVGQNIRRADPRNIWLQAMAPVGSKQDRASQQTPKFERGEILLPEEASWLRTFEEELLAFPHAKHDDQVDSVVQFLAAFDSGDLLHLAEVAKRR
jgi:predicted phage terminase large subunit-like protein